MTKGIFLGVFISMFLLVGACSSELNRKLVEASGVGDVDAMKECINKGADVDAYALDDVTPLTIAIEQNKPEAVKILLGAGADPNLSRAGLTPLFFALRDGHTEMALMLIESGGFLDFPDEIQASFRANVCSKISDERFHDALMRAGYVCGKN